MVAASPIVALAHLGGGEKTKQKQLAITFNDGGIVKDCSFNES